MNSVPHCESKVGVWGIVLTGARSYPLASAHPIRLSLLFPFFFYFSLSMHTTTATMWAHTLFLYPRLDVWWWDHARRRKGGGEKRAYMGTAIRNNKSFSTRYCLRSCPCMELRKSPCRRCSLFRDGPPSFRRERKRKWGLP